MWCKREKEREDKGGAEKQEFPEKKWKGGFLVAKRGGTCTPVPSWSWRLGGAQDTSSIKEPPALHHHTVSARQLAANLWEIQHYLLLAKMSKGGVRLRHHHQYHKENDVELQTHLPNFPPSPPEQSVSASSLRRHVMASLMQHHQSIEMSGHAPQPISPASYSSSLEVTPYKPAATPTSSLDFKGRIGESGYSLKTSGKLLNIVNRIWSLEEQHASSISLVKALKMEIDHTRARTKELLQERQVDRREIDDLMKQITEDKLVRKTKERNRIKAAVQSVRDELDDERKLRKQSESLHRKLARELSEVKSTFSNGQKELEIERRERILLEELCDEFAKVVVNHKSEKDQGDSDDYDPLILHISDAWLDERMQMKLLETRSDLTEKKRMVDKLSFEIETFLLAKRSSSSKNKNLFPNDPKREICLRRHSLESTHLNEAETSISQESENQEFAQEGVHERRNKQDWVRESKSKQVIDNLISSECLLSEGGKVRTENESCREDSCGRSAWRGHASPVKRWMSRLTSPDHEISESSSKWSKDLKENTLKTKLLKARLEGQHARVKVSKGSS